MNDYLPEELKEHLAEELQKAPKEGYVCPLCGSGTGKNKTGALHLRENGTKFHCFSCGKEGDILDLYQLRDGLGKAEALQKIKDKYGYTQTPDRSTPKETKEKPKTEEVSKYIDEALRSIGAAQAYLKTRGLTEETIQTFRIGYDPKQKAIVIPYPGKEYYITRSIAGKEYRKPRTEDAGKEPLFIAGDPEATEVYICEGQIDAISLYQSGAKLAIATGGAGKANLQDIRQKIIYIVPDNDEPGETQAKDLQAYFADDPTARSINILRLPEEYKDANEMLQKDSEGLRQLVDPKEIYKKGSALYASRGLFTDEAAQAKPIATGFDRLNEALGGGLFPGLYVLGAVSSLGKTTFLLQIADSIAYYGGEVIFFSLEMSKYELIAKSFSRLSYELAENKRNAKTTRGILDPTRVLKYNPEEEKLMKETVPAAYEKYAGNLYINEGLGDIGVKDIRQAVQKHISITGVHPTVFIDYLQILRPADPHLTDKQAVDVNVMELKKISRDLSVPIFAISSFNRENYYAPLTMTAFKESGAIEYSSDVLLGLQPEGLKTTNGKDKAAGENKDTIDKCKETDVRHIELKVLKNRNGQTNVVVPYTYYAMFNRFVEAPSDAEDFESV